MRRKPKHSSNKTTICVAKETVERLKEVSRKGESYDKLLSRILSGQGEVFVEVLHVDGDAPAKHQVLLRLGDFLYLWTGSRFVPVDQNKVKTVVGA